VTPGKPLRMSMGNQPPYTFPFDTRSVPDGLYILDALAWDAFENEGKAPSVLFGVANNTMHPTFMGDLDQARSSANSDLTASVLDPGIGSRTGKSLNRNNVVSSQVRPSASNSLRAALPPSGTEASARPALGPVEAPGADAMTSIPARKMATPPSTSRAASTRNTGAGGHAFPRCRCRARGLPLLVRNRPRRAVLTRSRKSRCRRRGSLWTRPHVAAVPRRRQKLCVRAVA
jgi:hypothetical protein